MAGPWEDYAPVAAPTGGAGPWDDYEPAPKPKRAPVTIDQPESPYSPKNLAGAAVEPTISLATGALAGPLSGLAGIAGSALPGPEGQGAAWTRGVGEAMTYEPRTAGGRTALGAIAAPFEEYAKGTDWAGGGLSEATGSPAIGAGANALLQLIPQLLFSKGLGRAAPIEAPPKNVKAAAASAKGLTMTPEEAGAGPIARTLSGLSGEPKLAKGISQKNQPTYQRMVSEDVGLPKGTEVTIDALDGVRQSAGKAYEAARKMGEVTLDREFHNDLTRIVGDYARAEVDFPGRKNPVMDMAERLARQVANADSVVSEINSLRKDMKRFYASRDFEAAHAAADASRALESQLIRHAQTSGQSPEIVQAMLAARTQIAKTYAAQKALGTGTEINPQIYAKELAKGTPLTGPARTIGEFGRDFPRSSQPPRAGASMGAPTAWDVGLAMMSGGKELPMLFARPATRMALASSAGQRMMINPPPAGHALARGLPYGGLQQGQIGPPPEDEPEMTSAQRDQYWKDLAKRERARLRDIGKKSAAAKERMVLR